MGRLLCLRCAILAVATAASMVAVARADVLPPADEESGWAVLSLEAVASLEGPVGGRKSLSLWETLGNVARL